jgi:hypothetical protein
MKYIITEQQEEKLKNNMTNIIQSYLNGNIKNYYAINRFLVEYDDVDNSFHINIFFDRQISIEMGGGMNMLIRRAGVSISDELNMMFAGLNFRYYAHYE